MKKLTAIASVAVFLIRNGLSFRGHRDDGKLNLTAGESEENQGLFRQLVSHQAQHGDSVLKSHIQSVPGNGSYFSKMPWVSSFPDNFSDIRAAQYFTILADETADVSGKEQMSYCVRFFNSAENHINDVFLGFEHVDDMTGRGLADMILKFLREKCQLDLKFLVGQGYGGASAMAGCFNGVQKLIREVCPSAAYTHCACHNLNLTLSASFEDLNIRAVVTEISACINFFQTPKRLAVLQTAIETNCPASSHHGLQRYCATRWVERHDGIAIFTELYPALIAALEVIQRWPGKDKASTQALARLQAIGEGSFLVGMVVLQKILSLTAPVARAFQDPEGDLLQCMEQVTQLVEVLQEWRSDDAAFFNSWFSEAEKIGDQPIAKPRYVKRAVYAKNYPTETPSQYYRVVVFNPVIDMVISQLQQRFQAHEPAANHLAALVPKFISGRSFDDLRPAYDIYASF